MRDEPEPLEADASILEAMRAFGAPEEDIERARLAIESREATARQGFAVWPENQASVQLLIDTRTQWVYAGLEARRAGLDYQRVIGWITLMARGPRRRHRALMRDLQLMEMAVLAADQELIEHEER